MIINGTDYSEDEIIKVVNGLADLHAVSLQAIIAIHCGAIKQVHLVFENGYKDYPMEDLYEMVRWYLSRKEEGRA